jgi:TetR/AcrR family transcriptional regulator, transcriptional repressor of bet genes
VRSVAAEAGVSAGLVRHHFDGMHRLVAETYRSTGKEIAVVVAAALEAAGSAPEARLRAFIDANLHPPLLDPDRLAVWLAFWSLARSDAEIRRIHARVYREYRRMIAEMVAALAEALGRTIDARRAALHLVALLDGLWLEHCLDPQTFDAAEAGAIAHRWIDALKTA